MYYLIAISRIIVIINSVDYKLSFFLRRNRKRPTSWMGSDANRWKLKFSAFTSLFLPFQHRGKDVVQLQRELFSIWKLNYSGLTEFYLIHVSMKCFREKHWRNFQQRIESSVLWWPLTVKKMANKSIYSQSNCEIHWKWWTRGAWINLHKQLKKWKNPETP